MMRGLEVGKGIRDVGLTIAGKTATLPHDFNDRQSLWYWRMYAVTPASRKNPLMEIMAKISS